MKYFRSNGLTAIFRSKFSSLIASTNTHASSVVAFDTYEYLRYELLDILDTDLSHIYLTTFLLFFIPYHRSTVWMTVAAIEVNDAPLSKVTGFSSGSHGRPATLMKI